MNDAKIQFYDCKSRIDLQQLQNLFQEGTFWAQNRNLEDLDIAIANSNPVVAAWDGGKLIGFARATSDGVYRATIWDVVVHPNYRGMGLGKKLVSFLLDRPLMKRVERIYLMTTYQQSFYEKLGFESNSSTTMVLNNQLSDREALSPGGNRPNAHQLPETISTAKLSLVQ